MIVDVSTPALDVEIRSTSYAHEHLTAVSVTQELNTLDHFSITMLHPLAGLPPTQRTTPPVAPGDAVFINMGYAGAVRQVFGGVATRVGASFPSDDAPTVFVEGHSRLYELTRDMRSCAFERVTDGQLAARIATRYGLIPHIDAGRAPVHERVVQYNETDFDFLQQRARLSGVALHVDDRTLRFAALPGSGDSALTLTWAAGGEPMSSLRRFDVAIDDSAAPAEISVSGASNGQVQRGRSRLVSQVGRTAVPGEIQDFRPRKIAVVDRIVDSDEVAEMIAVAIRRDRALRLVTGLGECLGNPAIRAGEIVTIDGIDTAYTGRYVITRVTHQHDHRGYETSFTASGLMGLNQ